MRCWFLCCLLTLLAVPAAAAQAPAGGLSYAVADIDAVGFERLEAIKASPGIAWWVELDDRLLVAGAPAGLDALARSVRLEPVPPERARGQLFVVRRAHQRNLLDADLSVLAQGAGYAVVAAHGGAEELERHLAADAEGAGCAAHAGLLALPPDTVLARQAANAPPRPASRLFGAGVQQLVDSIDDTRWFADIETLAGFNRYTHGQEILAARDWIEAALSSLPGLAVSTTTFQVGGTTAFNVIATLPGTTRPDDWYLIGAHYDSTSQSPGTAAPGAEDNASGCAGVVEMARILSLARTEGTVFFICYSGEEQGLHGSNDHAGDLVASGDDDKVQAVLIMDMVGYTADSDLDCLLETSPFAQPMIDTFSAAAAQYTTLRIVTSLFPFGSDHVPYLNRGMMALLTIENDWNIYPGYHRTTDLPANISLDMGRETLKMNVAAMAGLAGSPALVEIFSGGFETGDFSGWTMAVEEP